MMNVLWQIWLSVLVAAISCDATIAFAWQGERTLVISAAGNADSAMIADQVCQKFNVPKTRVLSLEFPPGDRLSRTLWEDSLRPKVAMWINENDPDEKIENVVTVYGTPLAVTAWEDQRELKPWRAFYDRALNRRIDRLNEAFQQLAELGGKDGDSILGESITTEQPPDVIRQRFDGLVVAAQKGVANVPFEERDQATATLQATVQRIAGLPPFLSSLQKAAQSGASDSAKSSEQFQYLRGRSEAFSQVAVLLEQTPASFSRDSTVLQLVEQNGGLVSAIGWLKQQMKLVDDNDSMASLDSELALVLWPEYRRLGTVPNLLHPAFKNSPLHSVYRTLSVNRIDGPTPASALALMERALDAAKIEKVAGKVYVDLRGVTGNDAVANRTERWLQSVANQFKSKDGIELVVEPTAQLFPVNGCPETLLYCGWYSLEKYIDSFTFVPGSIAYHLTPGDALGIHAPENQGWCRNLIENGATVVIGSVGPAEEIGLSSLSIEQKRIHPLMLSSGMIVFGIDWQFGLAPNSNATGQ